MDDFGVKYFNKDDAYHLLESLKNHYAISTYWEGCNYLGLIIDWNYSAEYVDILITEYAKKALDRLQHPKPERLQCAPHLWTVYDYRKRLHMEPDPDGSNMLDNKSFKRI